MVAFALAHRDPAGCHEFVATGTTGGRSGSLPGLELTRLKSGPLGGDQQIGALIAEGADRRADFLRRSADADAA